MTTSNLEVTTWRDEHTDSIFIKLCQLTPMWGRRTPKRGCILKITDEMLYNLVEGQEYPIVTPEVVGRLPEEIKHLEVKKEPSRAEKILDEE